MDLFCLLPVCMYVYRVMAADTSKVRAIGVQEGAVDIACVCLLRLFLSVMQAVTVGSQVV